ncbi:MAG TPA: cache domain-containing protein, partial [Candidatus Wunengus sp. YC63]|uniref:cache domain-containing protein n=1 Tax=unclassified Candidatus Wunengus TaxID=3367695 RepID=UPI004027BBFA
MYISIKNKLILLLIAFTLLPFILLRIIAYPRVQADLQDVLIRNLDGIGHKQAELVTNWMRERIKDARVIASNPMVARCARITTEDKDYMDILQYLEVAKIEYGYSGVLISNEKGSVTITTIDESGIHDISGTDYFKQAMEGNTFVSGVIPSEIPLLNEVGEMELGMPTMFVSAPLKGRNGVVIGVIALRIDIDMLNDLMLSLRLGKTGETYLANKDGYMITESRLSMHLKDTGRVKKRSALELKLVNPETGELTDGVKQCVTGNSGFNAKGYKDYRGRMVLGVWRWLPEFNWGVMAEIDRDEGYGAAYNLNRIVSSVLL